MKTRNKVLLMLAGIAIVAAGVGLSMYFKPHKDFATSVPDFQLTAAELLREFSTDEMAANRKYVNNDRTVLVMGLLNAVSVNSDGTSSVELQESGMEGVVSCSLMPSENAKVPSLPKGRKVSVKGQCTGIQELVDKEVIMIRCVIVE